MGALAEVPHTGFLQDWAAVAARGLEQGDEVAPDDGMSESLLEVELEEGEAVVVGQREHVDTHGSVLDVGGGAGVDVLEQGPELKNRLLA